MDSGIKTYKVKLKVLSPTYIGSGESYNKCDYIRIGNKICILDQDKWISYLMETRLLNSFTSYLEKFGKNARIDTWIKNNGKRIEDVEKRCTFTKFNISQFEDFKNNDISSFIKDVHGNPYFPGSSIKGAIISALTGKIAKDNELTYNSDIKEIKINGISVSDSTSFSPDSLELYKKIDNVIVNNKIKTAKLPSYKECAKSGVEVEFILTIDKYKLEKSCSDLQEIKKSDKNTRQKYSIIKNTDAIAKCKDINYIFELLSIKYNNLYGINGVISEAKQALDYLPNKSNEKGVIILGGETGVQAKSIISSIYDKDKAIEETKNTLNNIKSFKKHKHFLDKPISPRALKVCMDNGRQVYMGFCKLDLIAGDKY